MTDEYEEPSWLNGAQEEIAHLFNRREYLTERMEAATDPNLRSSFAYEISVLEARLADLTGPAHTPDQTDHRPHGAVQPDDQHLEGWRFDEPRDERHDFDAVHDAIRDAAQRYDAGEHISDQPASDHQQADPRPADHQQADHHPDEVPANGLHQNGAATNG
ncbi:MAG: hypothetical protein AAGA65_24815, partial [Actinomycetota bacterium]